MEFIILKIRKRDLQSFKIWACNFTKISFFINILHILHLNFKNSFSRKLFLMAVSIYNQSYNGSNCNTKYLLPQTIFSKSSTLFDLIPSYFFASTSSFLPPTLLLLTFSFFDFQLLFIFFFNFSFHANFFFWLSSFFFYF